MAKPKYVISKEQGTPLYGHGTLHCKDGAILDICFVYESCMPSLPVSVTCSDGKFYDVTQQNHDVKNWRVRGDLDLNER